jgi:hypothetical protein
MIQAYAGCAKTTTLALAGGKIKVPGLALAFNKSIAQELEKRFEPNFAVRTMNGAGFAALRRQFSRVTNWEIDNKKNGKIVTAMAKERKIALASSDWQAVVALVGAAQNAGLVPRRQGQGLVDDDFRVWEDLGDGLMLHRDDMGLYAELASTALARSNELTTQGRISFDDQIYYPVAFGAEFTRYPAVLVDEAQDLNGLNHEMIRRSLRPDSKLVVCGDPLQSIYAFRGSVNESMKKMLGLRNEWEHLALRVTFRCPRIVVRRQQTHAPGFTAAAGCRDGLWQRLGRAEDQLSWNRQDIPQIGTVAVLCRNNAPLLGLAFKLLAQRIGVVMLGRDLGKGLVGLCRKIEPVGSTSAATFAAKLDAWAEKEISLAEANGLDANVESIWDRAGCIRTVIGSCDPRTVDDICAQLEALFARETGLVTLSSIHKAKGREWDCVIHLDPWRLPSRQAKDAALLGNLRPMQQERNLLYVCETRTRNWLIEANLADFARGKAMVD